MKNLARLGLLLSLPALSAITACGKEENLHPPVLVEFPHSFPEAPRPLFVQNTTAAMTGHAIAATVDHLFVADRDNRELVRLDRKTLTRQASVALGGKPEQIVVGDDGAVFVSLRNGEVLRVSSQLLIEARRKLGTDVFGLALSPDATTLYATLPFERELFTLDTADLEEVATPVALLDTPRGVTVSPNGWLMVVHQFSGTLKIGLEDNLPVDTISESPLRIGNPAEFVERLRLDGLHAARALAAAVSPEDGSVFIAHITAAPGTESGFMNATTSQVSGDVGAAPSDGYGGSSTPTAAFPIPTRPIEVTVTATDSNGATLASEPAFPVQDVLTGEPMLGLLDQPSDIAHHPTWSLLFVTGYGSDNVLVMSTGETGADPARSPLAIIDVGHAPRGIAFAPDGNTAYVVNEHQLTVSAIDLTPFFTLEVMANGHPVQADGSEVFGTPSAMSGAVPVPFMDATQTPPDSRPEFDSESPRVRPFRLSAAKSSTYGIDPMPATVRRGARTYTFARNENMSHAGEFACGTCHFEGGEDKLVWFISDGPRQTPALAGRLLGTAPFNWGGTKDALKDNMTETVARMRGDGLTQQELTDLEQFLLFGLEAPANPNLAPNGQLTPDQLAGKILFQDKTVGCSSCHRPEQNFTDGFGHDVGTASQAEVIRFQFDQAVNPDAKPPGRLNTPTLKGLFYTAPYLHDGSEKTLRAVLDRTSDTMGKTSHLSDVQKEQLVAYLMTL